MAKKKTLNLILKIFFGIIFAILKTLTISFFINTKQQVKFAKNPELKDQIKREQENKKIIDRLKERMERLERLTYAIHEDPEYLKSERGKTDLKEIKKEIK